MFSRSSIGIGTAVAILQDTLPLLWVENRACCNNNTLATKSYPPNCSQHFIGGKTRVSDFFKKNGPFPASFSLFSSFHYSWQLMFNINFCQWPDSNCGPLELEVTALPTEPQPLPIRLSDFVSPFSVFLLLHFSPSWAKQKLFGEGNLQKFKRLTQRSGQCGQRSANWMVWWSWWCDLGIRALASKQTAFPRPNYSQAMGQPENTH